MFGNGIGGRRGRTSREGSKGGQVKAQFVFQDESSQPSASGAIKLEAGDHGQIVQSSNIK